MAFDIFYQLRRKEIPWIDYLFYVSFAFLVVVVFSYFILYLKIYLQNQQIIYLENRIADYGTQEQKNYEKKILDYKKKIDNFTSIMNAHKISSNIFTFIEERTLPEVWFSDFDLSAGLSNQVRLAGETENMETVSRQLQAFEESQYVEGVNILNSQIRPTGKVSFILNISLDPKVFSYMNDSSLLYR